MALLKRFKKPLSMIMMFAAAAPCYASWLKKKDVSGSDAEHPQIIRTEVSVTPYEPSRSPKAELEISASAFTPSKFTRNNDADSAFHMGSMPAVGLSRIAKVMDLADGALLSWKVGVGYMALERSGVAPTPSAEPSKPFELFSGRLGFLGSWPGILPMSIVPSFGLNLLPTWGSLASSAIEKSVSAFGLPVEATLGFFYRPHAWDFGFGISGNSIFGSIGGSSLAGLGISGEIRWAL